MPPASFQLPVGLSILVISARVINCKFFGEKRVFEGKAVKWLLIVLYFTLPTSSVIISSAFACSRYDAGAGFDEFMTVDKVRRVDVLFKLTSDCTLTPDVALYRSSPVATPVTLPL